MKVFVFAVALTILPVSGAAPSITSGVLCACGVYDDAVLEDWAQDAPKPAPALVPTLTLEEKKDVRIAAQAYENAQLRVELARAELIALLRTLQKEGFDLDLQTLAYVKKPSAKEPEPKKKDGSQ